MHRYKINGHADPSRVLFPNGQQPETLAMCCNCKPRHTEVYKAHEKLQK